MSAIVKALIIGLPESGKTTLLAALWYLLNSDEHATTLRVAHIRGDRVHLNRIRDSWLQCRPVERTTVTSERSVSLHLRDGEFGNEFELSLPDLAGESFLAQWRDRKWTKDYDDLVVQSIGVLLTFHPASINEGPTIDDAARLVGELEETDKVDEKESQKESQTTKNSSEDWDPDKAPTQVQLVDLLQLINERRAGEPLRLAVVISAWDLVAASGSWTPRDWLRRRLPLLDQFLRANAEQFEWRVYGVSAQGGDLEKKAERERLCAQERQADRIMIVDEEEERTHCDLTAPLRWLIRASS
jgi:hypothetical protein